jgi:SseB protein C-terminal domain/SseB protein N-terminal domain
LALFLAMAFTPVNELERLLVAAATDAAARPAFYRGLAQHELFVITEGRKPERNQQFVADENTSLQIRMIELDGKLYAPIFTSVERISAVVPKEVGCVAMKGDSVFAMLRGKDLVMNPGAEYGKIFFAHEVESIVNGSIFNPQETRDVGGKKILLGQPKDYPRHIADALTRFFSRSRDVKAAYLAHVFIPDIDQAPHTLIGIEIGGDWRKVVEEAGVVVREVAKPGEIVDFVQLRPQATDTVADYMQRQTIPFYVRKKWLGLF